MRINLILLFTVLCIISCNKELNTSKKNHSIIEKKQIQEIILPDTFLTKYDKKTFFIIILKKDLALKKDLQQALEKKTEVYYNEIKFEKDLILCQFTLTEGVLYNYCYRNDKMIYKSCIPINRAHLNFNYKDWNNDLKPELISDYEEWEGGANLGYRKIRSIYEIKIDTIMKVIDLPIENIFCQDGIISNIEKYKYKFNKKNNELSIKKIIGRGDCNSKKMQKVITKKEKNILLNGYNIKTDF